MKLRSAPLATALATALLLAVPAQAQDQSKVSDDITLAANQKAGNLTTVSGDVDGGQGVQLKDVETVSGDVELGHQARTGAITTVSGDVRVGTTATVCSCRPSGAMDPVALVGDALVGDALVGERYSAANGFGKPGEWAGASCSHTPCSEVRVVVSTISAMSDQPVVRMCSRSVLGPSAVGLRNTCGVARIALLRGCVSCGARTARALRAGLGGRAPILAARFLRALAGLVFSLFGDDAPGIDGRRRACMVPARNPQHDASVT